MKTGQMLLFDISAYETGKKEKTIYDMASEIYRTSFDLLLRMATLDKEQFFQL